MDSLLTRKTSPYRHDQSKEFDYLCVDSFIKNIVDERVLGTAFELRIIDSYKPPSQVVVVDLEMPFFLVTGTKEPG